MRIEDTREKQMNITITTHSIDEGVLIKRGDEPFSFMPKYIIEKDSRFAWSEIGRSHAEAYGRKETSK